MTKTILEGKSCAGNLYVSPPQCSGVTGRFDEGEVASSATPRRGVLLYKKAIHKMTCAAAVAAVLTAGCSSTKSAEKPFAVSSFNMRTDCKADQGDLAWANRFPRILKIIEGHRLEIIGAQELKENQVANLRDALEPKGYEIVGRGRLEEGKSEGVYIIYNAKRFDCTASDTFQLSETPEVWGSSSWNSAYPRTCAWVQLKDRESGAEFRLYNTHLDNESELARRKGMELTVGKINADVSAGMTAFLTGDFNNELKPGNAIDYVRKSMRDTADISATPHQGPAKTFHGYHPPARTLIDYVFVKGKVKVLSHATLDDMPGGKLPSDHFPVAVTVAL